MTVPLSELIGFSEGFAERHAIDPDLEILILDRIDRRDSQYVFLRSERTHREQRVHMDDLPNIPERRGILIGVPYVLIDGKFAFADVPLVAV